MEESHTLTLPTPNFEHRDRNRWQRSKTPSLNTKKLSHRPHRYRYRLSISINPDLHRLLANRNHQLTTTARPPFPKHKIPAKLARLIRPERASKPCCDQTEYLPCFRCKVGIFMLGRGTAQARSKIHSDNSRIIIIMGVGPKYSVPSCC